MTTPLWCLCIAVLMPYILTAVGVYYKTKLPDGLDTKNPRVQTTHLEGAGARAYAAQTNSWEALGVFTAAVVINHIGHGDPGASATAAMVFIAARVIHPILYIKGIHHLRTLSFVTGFGACLYLIYLAISAPI